MMNEKKIEVETVVERLWHDAGSAVAMLASKKDIFSKQNITDDFVRKYTGNKKSYNNSKQKNTHDFFEALGRNLIFMLYKYLLYSLY